jgi:hypothetical protein
MGCHSFNFNVFLSDNGYRVSLTGAGIPEPTEDTFVFDSSPDTALASALEAISENVPTLDDIKYAGKELWLGLTSGNVGRALRECRDAATQHASFQYRLSLAEELRGLPWEALYDDAVGFLASKLNHSIIQEPSATTRFDSRQPRSPDGLSMLLIVPASSRLNSGEERSVIEAEASERGCVPVPLIQTVTADKVHEALTKGQVWHIVHYIGHGRIDGNTKRTEIVLDDNDGTERWLDAETFANDFRAAGVRLAIMNCCLSAGSAERHDSLNGLGPLLMREGVPAVVAMRYAISDRMARTFAKTFYSVFFNGQVPGRVDVAAEAAREALLRNQSPDELRSFITPVLHLALGFEQLFAFPKKREAIIPPPVRPRRNLQVIPGELLSAIQNGRCVPVVGPGILRLGAMRNDYRPPPGPLELARELADDPSWRYPCPEEIDITEKAGEWMSAQLLQRVAQHYNLKNGLGDVVEKIKKKYREAQMTPIIERLARWRVPALFYTYFDGLLDDCQRAGNSAFTTAIRRVDQPPAIDPALAESRRLLILLRGSIFDDSLVLTESENENLAIQITKMDKQIANVALKPSRCVLFIGVSPRDVLVRQLAREILETNIDRRQGPPFFVCSNHSSVDEAYWKRFAMNWINGELDTLLPAFLEAAQ